MEDIIIRGGTVLDGEGSPGVRADVAVRDGLITRIGDCSDLSAKEVLDATGLTVAPGFIDAHSHSDTSFIYDSGCSGKLCQGITTEVAGQCGDSPFPALPERLEAQRSAEGHYWASFDDYVNYSEKENHPLANNLAMLMGHGSLRAGVMGCGDRPATAEELEQMKALLRRDLEAGIWGMSLGLEYSPGFFADRHELEELASVVREFDGLVPCHMRNEGVHIHEAIDELAGIGKKTGAHVHVSHLKIDNFRVHGTADKVWEQILQARREGVNISADLYPYTASCTSLTIRCPQWSKDGGGRAVVNFLQGPRRQEVIEGIRQHYFNAERAETCVFQDDHGYWPEIVGKNLRQVAEDFLHTTDYAEAAAEVLIRTKGTMSCVFFVMSEEDMLYFLSQDTGVCTDGSAQPLDPAKVHGRPHPRAYGAIVEFLRLAREKKLCSLEEAVRRITSKSADMIGLTDRGRLKPGLAADITVFDPETVAPLATYMNPIQPAAGIRHIIVNGGVAMRDGVQTDFRGGKLLRKHH